jgi:hypothetical protein
MRNNARNPASNFFLRAPAKGAPVAIACFLSSGMLRPSSTAAQGLWRLRGVIPIGFMIRILLVSVVLGFICVARPAKGQTAVSAAGTTNAIRVTPQYVNALADQMRSNHPALRAAWARTNAAAAGAAAVRTWEDPMFELGGLAAERSMREEDGDIIYGIGQKLPLWGKPKAERRMARAELCTEMANADYQAQLLRRNLAKAAFAAALANASIDYGQQDVVWSRPDYNPGKPR